MAERWMAAFAAALTWAACSNQGGSPALSPSNYQPRYDCSLVSPCDAVRQQWFANEIKDAELMANFCEPPGAGNVHVCQGLDGAIANLHRVNVDYFSDVCRRSAQKPATALGIVLGRPDRDEAAPCGTAQCRIWIWYWFAGGKSGIFTVLLRLPPGATEAVLERCNYCTPEACQDMPTALPTTPTKPALNRTPD